MHYTYIFITFVAASTFAPLRNNSVTMLTCPSFEARWRALRPFYKRKNSIKLIIGNIIYFTPVIEMENNLVFLEFAQTRILQEGSYCATDFLCS